MMETTTAAKSSTKYVMVYSNDQNAFEERDLEAETSEDAKAQFMGLIRVLGIKIAYVMERENELVVHSYP